jgi:hypothetical protein
MSRVFVLVAVVAAAGIAIVSLRDRLSVSGEVLFQGRTKPPEAAPLCPWREPKADLKAFFPKATRYQIESRILSGLRTELGQRLGRTLTGDENTLHLYRVFEEEAKVGTIMTKRVKGEFGAIELVLATDVGDEVCGMRLQRLREPELVADALTNPQWQHSFMGLTCESAWKLGQDIANVPVEASTSAQAVVDGAKSLVILLTVSGQSRSPAIVSRPHH